MSTRWNQWERTSTDLLLILTFSVSYSREPFVRCSRVCVLVGSGFVFDAIVQDSGISETSECYIVSLRILVVSGSGGQLGVCVTVVTAFNNIESKATRSRYHRRIDNVMYT